MYQPLADKLRPQTIDDVVGQDHLCKDDGVLARALKTGQVASMILWGPPGTGKTTIAKLIAKTIEGEFTLFSAVATGVAELKKYFKDAEVRHQQGLKNLLMIDEIHRFNRSQQDIFLPYIENGTIILIGATTENPSFELNAALLSRCQVLVVHRLDVDALYRMIERAEHYMQQSLPITQGAKEALCHMADGDGRYLLGLCEQLFSYDTKGALLDEQALSNVLYKRKPIYDKDREGHYNLISALHKSLRGSDVDAALYWFNRMLEGGEDPLYITRRLVRFAV